MKAADYVNKQADLWKKAGKALDWILWQVCLLCVGWPYVFGARGVKCTPANRKSYYKSHADHPTIKSKCQVIRADNPKDSCNGCKWFPDKQRVLFFDCMGFVYWAIRLVYGFNLKGAGATSQWNTKSNWKVQGTIDTCPKDQLVVLYAQNKAKKTLSMKHTAFGWGNETIECAVGVQHKTKRDSQFTHWGIPVCFAADYVPPEQKPADKKEDKTVEKTIRKGNMGEAVKKCQKLLQQLGYDLGVCGVDGDYGVATEKAVRAFQKASGLKVDGICGPDTWKALEKAAEAGKPADKPKTYTVTITGLTKEKADEIVKKYGGKATAE